MSLATTAGVLSCLLCTRTIIITRFQEHDTLIRAISGLLAGILTAYFAAPPVSSSLDSRRRHRIRIDDENIKISLIGLSIYALFDIVVNPHFIWAIFPLLGWTASSVLLSQSLQEPEDYSERRHIDRHGRITVTKTRSKSDITAQNSHESNIKPRASSVINEANVFLVNRDDHASSASNLATRATTIRNSPTIQVIDDVMILPTNSTHRPTKTGSPHVKFVETASRHRHKPTYETPTKRQKLFENVVEPNPPNPAPVAVPMTTLLPLTATNIQRISQSPTYSDDIEGDVAISDYLTFHTAQSTFSESDSSETDSQYTLARTVQSGVSGSTTTKASLTLGQELVLYGGPSNEEERRYEEPGSDEESSSEEEVDNAVIRLNDAAPPNEYIPHLIPQDYISQTYVRVEKFVSEVGGTELGEQIRVISGESQYDKTELRNQKKYLESLLVYEPSETSSSTTVRLSELEGNMKAIDRRADEYRKQSLEAKKKISTLGEKRKNALKNKRSSEAFRIKCTMQEYQKEADRADKKAAKLYFRARNKPGTSTIDVHALKKEEALKAVEMALREVQLRGGHQLRVIVGQGLHSKSGQPVLKPSVISEFRKQEMRVFESPNNPGMLIINMS